VSVARFGGGRDSSSPAVDFAHFIPGNFANFADVQFIGANSSTVGLFQSFKDNDGQSDTPLGRAPLGQIVAYRTAL